MAKENAIATLGVLYGRTAEFGLLETISMTYSPAVGLAFMVVTLLFIPCAANRRCHLTGKQVPGKLDGWQTSC